MNGQPSIVAKKNYNTVLAALTPSIYLTVGDLQDLTKLHRTTIRAALSYLRDCGYARFEPGEGWVAVVKPSSVE